MLLCEQFSGKNNEIQLLLEQQITLLLYVWQLHVSALFTLRHHQTPVTIKCRGKTSNATALEVKMIAEISNFTFKNIKLVITSYCH